MGFPSGVRQLPVRTDRSTHRAHELLHSRVHQSTNTQKPATAWTWTAHHLYLPISDLECSPSAKPSTPHSPRLTGEESGVREKIPGSTSSFGASSTSKSCITFRMSQKLPSMHRWQTSPGEMTNPNSPHGKKDAQAFPSSMPPCVNSKRQAGCTTARV